MKESQDTQTIDAFPTPKKRGRPSTGMAKSAAVRKREQRERDWMRVWGNDADLSKATTTALLEQLAVAVQRGLAEAARNISNELVSRSFSARIEKQKKALQLLDNQKD